MDRYNHHYFKTSRGLDYAYYMNKPEGAADDKPGLLFLHGFPDDSLLWSKVIESQAEVFQQYTVIVPDLLGAGDTSKPLDASKLESRAMVEDLIELLDHENVKTFIPIGHDWGSFLASRINFWYPERLTGLVLFNVAYLPPNREQPFNLEQFNAMLEKMTGYPTLAYQAFFTAPDAAKIIESRPERFYTALHGDKENWMRDIFSVYDGMRNFLESDEDVPLKSYAKDPEVKERFMTRLARNGISGQLQWYYAMVNNIHAKEENALDPSRYLCKVPLLYIACTGDYVASPRMMDGASKAGLVPRLTTKTFDIGHWSPFEDPSGVAKAVTDWLGDLSQ